MRSLNLFRPATPTEQPGMAAFRALLPPGFMHDPAEKARLVTLIGKFFPREMFDMITGLDSGQIPVYDGEAHAGDVIERQRRALAALGPLDEGAIQDLLADVATLIAAPGLYEQLFESVQARAEDCAASDAGSQLLLAWFHRLHEEGQEAFEPLLQTITRWNARKHEQWMKGSAAFRHLALADAEGDLPHNVEFDRAARGLLTTCGEFAEARYRPYVNFLFEVAVACNRVPGSARTFGQRSQALASLFSSEHREFSGLLDRQAYVVRNAHAHVWFRLLYESRQVVLLTEAGRERARLTTHDLRAMLDHMVAFAGDGGSWHWAMEVVAARLVPHWLPGEVEKWRSALVPPPPDVK